MTYGRTLEALASPVRRRIFDRVKDRAYTVGELAAFARLQQPTVTQHLQVLHRARLITYENVGTRRYCRGSTEGLIALRRYLESYWDGVLDAFAAADPKPPSGRRPPRKRSGR
jgi:DNA-binding transcriptional ArsR family regulator